MAPRQGRKQAQSYKAFASRHGGVLEREALSPDSGLGAAWKLGEEAAALAQSRLADAGVSEAPIYASILKKPMINAVATKLDLGHAASIFWPLPLTMQAVAAAIWANPKTAPWLGDVFRLRAASDFESLVPPGFYLFSAMLGKGRLDSSELRSGVRIDHINMIVEAGEDRWDAFLATALASINFVWGHELAHILYGHTAIVCADFGGLDLFESSVDQPCPIPSALSCFMEYVADMDAALNMFSMFYGSFLAEEGEAASDGHLVVRT